MIRVAIVEDDAEVQGVLQEYVRRYTRQYGTEFEVTLFADGVDILDDYRAVYDIIFLDVEMKHLDGMTTAERIRQMDAEVILIFITNMAQYAIRGYSVGALAAHAPGGRGHRQRRARPVRPEGGRPVQGRPHHHGAPG